MWHISRSQKETASVACRPGTISPAANNLDLEFVVGGLRHILGKMLRAAVEGIERLGPARRQAPLELRRGLRDGRSGKRADEPRAAGRAGGGQEFATIHMTIVDRRRFLAAAGAAGSAGSRPLAAPAIAQSSPEIKWRMTASWPKSLDTLYGGAEHFAKYVAEATDNKFQIQLFAAGEIVPGLQATEAVSNGTVETVPHGALLHVGQGSDVRAWLRGAVRPQHAHAEFLVDRKAAASR